MQRELRAGSNTRGSYRTWNMHVVLCMHKLWYMYNMYM